jgi:hypothetical protein
MKPTDEYLEYLDDLRESGVTNMYGAGEYLEAEFGLSKITAREYLRYWMETFTERHPQDG